MKNRAGLVLAAAVVLGLILVGGGAAAGIGIPNHSIGLKKLTPNLAKLIRQGAEQGEQGEQGPSGPVGPTGATGPQGPTGDANVLPYSATLTAGDPARTLAMAGPLTFVGSCQPLGEDQLIAKLEVTSSEDGVRINDKPLNEGEGKTLQELSVIVGAPEEEEFFPIIRAWNISGSFALQGVATLVVDSLSGRCQFFGSLIEDS